MAFASKKEVKFFETHNSKCPYLEWFDTTDKVTQNKIANRLRRITKGNLGKYKTIKGHEDLYEFKFNQYRIYFTMRKDLVVLLLGGNKDEQVRSISKAAEYLKEYKSND